MTHKLYYDDAYLKEFEANVIKTTSDYIVLDQTAFYPEGGGQPGDTGHLAGVGVYDTQEVDGEIRHYIKEPIERATVTGVIDWHRRFDHMQQHLGQHLLSATFDDVYGYKTIGFHLGKETVTIDLDIPSLQNEEMVHVERVVNSIVFENLDVETRFVTNDQLHHYPLRKAPTVDEQIRLVIVPEYDYNGCGGTHPLTTSEVGIIKLLKTEKVRKSVRLHFVCGLRAVQRWNIETKKMEEQFTELRRVNEDRSNQLEQAHEQLHHYEVREWVDGTHSVIERVYENRSIKDLQLLAKLATQEQPTLTVRLFTVIPHEKVQCVFARGNDVDLDMNECLKDFFSYDWWKRRGPKATCSRRSPL
ncbi:alanyl-tRNA editing protein [Geomicrobium sp. JCM 19055]|uniref:alanyl-tRNA editing protein n=1 Tax=Geomicrobium sp. JCM 19055 TaxID=1460649 RepID=UPI00045ED869|nr:alanyl-tRNA editing protein [Geomicrobium sp. JCM 19055]GAJ98247.1 alanyl-tRNA synthetase family protein [Geomicrobium sp. JCM 19055]